MHDDDYYGSYHFSDIRLELEEYDLVKETPKGYWIGSYINHRSEPFWKKWIPKESKKRFAYPTKKEALENYIKRTESRIKILESQKFECQIGLRRAKELKKKQNNES
jgi:hypothetical protein